MSDDFKKTKKEKPGRRPFNTGKKAPMGFAPKGEPRPVREYSSETGPRRPSRDAGRDERPSRGRPGAGFGGGFGEDRPRRPRPEGSAAPAGFGGGYRQPRGESTDRPRRAPAFRDENRGERPMRRGPSLNRGDDSERPVRKGPPADRGAPPRFNREGGEGRPMRRSSSFDRPSGPRYQAQNDEVPDGELPFRPHVQEGEIYYHGRNACEAIYKQRPRDIIRVYVKRELSAEFKDMLNYCAANRLAYHLVGDGDLERLTDTKHHDGVCVLAREKRFLNEKDFYKEIGGSRTLVMFLDGVGNPHNLGAILRTASHFGVKFVAGSDEELPKVSPAANRTSEGGAEHVSLVRVEEPESFFERLQKMGFQIYAFENSPKAISLFDTTINEKAVFVMGAEVEGLSGMTKSSADVLVKIPGTGAVESLNVSVAAALAMAEFTRQGTSARTVRIVKKK